MLTTILLLCYLLTTPGPCGELLPPREIRGGIISALAAEVERVDGDGLLPRSSRPWSWEKTIALLRAEAERAETPEQFGRVLKRFDATIPNHHMHGKMPEAFEPFTPPPWPFSAAPELIPADGRPRRYRIAGVSAADWAKGEEPRAGDELLAVAGRPMREWSDENFVFCKSPLRGQCERELFKNLARELLSWKRPEPLTLRLRRGERTWETTAPLPENWMALRESDPPPSPCRTPKERYPGFAPVHEGVNACVFSSPAHTGVFVLRIPSFAYQHDEHREIDSIHKELKRLYEGFWKARSGEIRTLIVDVIDNGGGTDPIAYYRLLFDHPFQEQFVQHRKLRELDDDWPRSGELWESMWPNRPWLEKLHRDGRWAKTPIGSFLPPRPQFCADPEDCEHALWTPWEHRFQGEILLLMNRRCVSSCAGFVYNLVDVLKGRVRTLGEPDSGDSTFARLSLDVTLDPRDPRGFHTELSPFGRDGDLGPVLYRQTVSVTRSTDARGRVISGLPQKIAVPVPARWDESEEEWNARVFSAALSGPAAPQEFSNP